MCANTRGHMLSSWYWPANAEEWPAAYTSSYIQKPSTHAQTWYDARQNMCIHAQLLIHDYTRICKFGSEADCTPINADIYSAELQYRLLHARTYQAHDTYQHLQLRTRLWKLEDVCRCTQIHAHLSVHVNPLLKCTCPSKHADAYCYALQAVDKCRIHV
jgi:hypothetical protein